MAVQACVLVGVALASARGATAGPASAASAPAASASSSASTAEAEFKEAQDRFLAKDYGGALPVFERVLAQSGSPNARLYVARCHKELGHLAEAYEQMERTVRDATRLAATEPKYEGTRNSAAVALAMMEPLIGKVTVAVAQPPPGMTVDIGGRTVASDRLGQPVAVEAGKVVVTATAPGRRMARHELEVGAGQTKTLTVVLEPDAQPEPTPSVTAPSEGGGAVRTAGIVVGGLGAASLIVCAITGGMALSTYNRLKDDCGGERCTDLAYADDVDRGETLRLVSNVTLAVGASLAVAGGLMVIFGGPDESSAEVSLELAPFGAGAQLRGRF